MGLSQYTEDELRYAVDIVRIDKRIKEIADYITVTNEENGVAKAMEKFVLI